MRTATATLACVCLLGFSGQSGERLTVRLTPPVDVAPAVLTVRTTIERSSDNRMLEVAVESPDYLRSSQLSLDGDRAARTHLLVFRDLPAGRYEITATVSGDHGPLAAATRWFQATNSGGR